MKRNNKKSILVVSAYIPPHIGGIERYTLNLVSQFMKNGYQPIIITSNYDNKDEFEIVDGIVIIRLPIYNLFKNRYPIVKLGKRTNLLMKKLDNYNIVRVIVNARFYLTSLMGVRYANKRKIPVYVVEHGSNYVTLDNKFIDFFANRYEDLLTFYLKKKVNGFYGVSEACGIWLKKFGIKFSGVWYNSINLDSNIVKKSKHKEINFLYVGRVIKQKGIYDSLVCFKKLSLKYDNIHFYVAGDGVELDNYKKEFCHDRIHFLGRLDFSELLKYYSLCDIFVYPPLHPEGLPTSILEAGMMKCAVIGTDMGGIKEIIINNENGIIVDGVGDLGIAMERLINDNDSRKKFSNAIYNTVKEKFSWNVTIKKILSDINLK